MDSDAARAIVKSEAAHPLYIQEDAKWVCWDMSIQNFALCPTFTFRNATQKKAAEMRPEIIQVSGRQGYNRAMCGKYRKGKLPHCGKNYYRHEKQDQLFKFPTYLRKKYFIWIIDWRVGLMS